MSTNQYHIKNLILPLIITCIIFCLFLPSFEMMYMDEAMAFRGYGFPFVFLTNNPATSLYMILDLKHLILDFCMYTIVVVFALLVISKILKRNLLQLPNKKVLFLLLAVALFELVYLSPLLYFTSIDPIDYTPVYSTIKIHLLFLNP